MRSLSPTELKAIDARVEHALSTGDLTELSVLGYGEISAVVAVDAREGAFAVKRLPPFPDEESFTRYNELFRRYLETLSARGLRPVESDLRSISTHHEVRAYCIQPILPPESLGPAWLRRANDEQARWFFEALVERVKSVARERVGIDAQVSNWSVQEEPRYLDVTTPMLRDEKGRDLLDVDLYLASLPWVLRGLVRRFVATDILDTYFDPRRSLIDMAANLIKERLEDRIATLLEVAAERVDPIARDEVERYYRQDARIWSLLLAVRRLDRAWQQRVRRRPYRFLLPGPIAR